MFVIDFSPHLGKKKHPVRNVRISPDGGTLAATFGEQNEASEAAWWSLTEGICIGSHVIRLKHLDPPAEPTFAPDLSRVFFHAREDSAVVDFVSALGPQDAWADAGKFALSGLPVQAEVGLGALEVTADGKWLIIAHDGQGDTPGLSVQPAQPKPGARRSKIRDMLFDQSEDLPCFLAVSPDGTRIACGFFSSAVRLYDFKSGEQTAEFDNVVSAKQTLDISGLAFSPDGTRLAARTAGRVTILDVTGEQTETTLKPSKLTDMAFTPDGRKLLTGGHDKLIRVWDTATWKEVARYDWKIGPIHSVTVSPDGAIAAAGGEKSRVVVWDLDG